MSNTSATTVSIVQVFEDIIEKTINNDKPVMTSGIVLFKAGSDLTATQLGKLSY